jgi:hypothetical protein
MRAAEPLAHPQPPLLIQVTQQYQLVILEKSHSFSCFIGIFIGALGKLFDAFKRINGSILGHSLRYGISHPGFEKRIATKIGWNQRLNLKHTEILLH